MDAEIFKRNLRELLEARGLKQKDFAEKSGLSYRWVRRICSQGLTRVEDRNREQLEALCEFFEVSPVERLWSEHLHNSQDGAALCEAKVKEILSFAHSLSEFSEFVPVGMELGTEPVGDLLALIDRLYTSMERNRDYILRWHQRQMKSQAMMDDSLPEIALLQNRKSAIEEIEYPTKLRAVLRSPPEGFFEMSNLMRSLIDAGYHQKESQRIRISFRDQCPDVFDQWLTWFQNKEIFDFAIGAALAAFSEAEILDWLANHRPPPKEETTSAERVASLKDMIRTSAETEAWKGIDLSTYGGPVGDE
ncbi:hypothetical protein KOR42_28600 [Thalassoglobus neptunius]|uniref:HTH cro/C1-type domain-containing protein n=1 Tax=Thalassoglobus neptunius TaxID=1938619 RepID=A0A5C5WWZ5_9PLAN|nr:helix-turn-helix transcriptional regulator [Thalassoglobus neptunius]TWT55474.1 hypothetical protein KOR42_28600 [Thalassoglobus neptunius]